MITFYECLNQKESVIMAATRKMRSQGPTENIDLDHRDGPNKGVFDIENEVCSSLTRLFAPWTRLLCCDDTC